VLAVEPARFVTAPRSRRDQTGHSSVLLTFVPRINRSVLSHASTSSVDGQFRELLTKLCSIGGIWFDALHDNFRWL